MDSMKILKFKLCLIKGPKQLDLSALLFRFWAFLKVLNMLMPLRFRFLASWQRSMRLVDLFQEVNINTVYTALTSARDRRS